MSTESLNTLCTQEEVHKVLLYQLLDKIFAQNSYYEFSIEQVLQMQAAYKLTPEELYELFMNIVGPIISRFWRLNKMVIRKKRLNTFINLLLAFLKLLSRIRFLERSLI
jgi:hypothetical protein